MNAGTGCNPALARREREDKQETARHLPGALFSVLKI
jgi:hypothetical protein